MLMEAKNKEYSDSLNYALYDGKYYNSSKCRMELGLVGGNNVSLYSGNLVDLESNLLEFKILLQNIQLNKIY